jgi:hypothetical protein
VSVACRLPREHRARAQALRFGALLSRWNATQIGAAKNVGHGWQQPRVFPPPRCPAARIPRQRRYPGASAGLWPRAVLVYCEAA